MINYKQIEPDYKIIVVNQRNEDVRVVVPRESFLKKVFSRPLKILGEENNIRFRPYNGASFEEVNQLSEDAQWVESCLDTPIGNAINICNLEYCDDGFSAMKNGHARDNSNISRTLMLMREDSTDIVGVINFGINITTKEAYIDRLSVSSNLQKNGIGSILLQYAVLVSSLYGCTNITLESVSSAINFYLKHGFLYYTSEEEIQDKLDSTFNPKDFIFHEDHNHDLGCKNIETIKKLSYHEGYHNNLLTLYLNKTRDCQIFNERAKANYPDMHLLNITSQSNNQMQELKTKLKQLIKDSRSENSIIAKRTKNTLNLFEKTSLKLTPSYQLAITKRNQQPSETAANAPEKAQVRMQMM